MLDRLNSLQNDIKVAIIGMGAMGKGLLYQCHITSGIKCIAIADIRLDRAVACAKWLELDYRIASSLKAVHEVIRQGFVAVCEDGDLLARCEFVGVLVESSNAIGAAARYAVTGLEFQKHLVLMNAEIDLIFGPYLLDLATRKGVVYTSCDGDQHIVIKRLIDDIRLWGFELVMAGNIKGFLDRYANPETIASEANKRNLDSRMCASYTDGTKLNIEMALVANATNLSTLTPGMNGPRANNIDEIFHLFDFRALWKNGQPWVDYLLGAEPNGGVFIVGYCDNQYQKSMLRYYKMGDGPFYLFYRPYHLCHVEAITCIAKAFLDKRSFLQPTFGFRTNVFSYAKRTLHKGEELDGIGGYTCYGLIENQATNDSNPGLPICLADKVKLKRDVAKGEKILLDDVDYDSTSFEFDLYAKALGCSGKRVS